jgi:adiponectin receptor
VDSQAGKLEAMIIPFSHLIINELVSITLVILTSFSLPPTSSAYTSLRFSKLFVIQLPRAKQPGRYNICGHSHQIWHVMVVLGIIFTYFGVMENFEMRKGSVCPV